MENKEKVDISTMSYIKFFGVILGLIFVFWIRDILLLLFVVLIIVAALGPMIEWAEDRKIPRALSTTLLFLLMVSAIILIVSSLIPPIINQLGSISTSMPTYLEKFSPIYNDLVHEIGSWQSFLSTFSKQLSNISSGFYNATRSFFAGLASLVTILVLSFYILLEKNKSRDMVINLMPKHRRESILNIFNKIGDKMGSWLRGQVLVSTIMGIGSGLIVAICGVPYALTIGLLAALLEIIPIIGPVVVGTIAGLFALMAGGWVTAIIVVIAFILLQQLEAQFLVPKVMGNAVGLSPVLIIVALLIGGELGGIAGAILAIPFAAGLSVVFQEWNKAK